MLNITKEDFNKEKIDSFLRKYATLSIRHMIISNTMSNIDITDKTNQELFNNYGSLQATLWNISKEMDKLRKLIVIAVHLCDDFKDIVYVLSNDSINSLIFKNVQRHYNYYIKNFDNDSYSNINSNDWDLKQSHNDVDDYYTSTDRIKYVDNSSLLDENNELREILGQLVYGAVNNDISVETINKAKNILENKG